MTLLNTTVIVIDKSTKDLCAHFVDIIRTLSALELLRNLGSARISTLMNSCRLSPCKVNITTDRCISCHIPTDLHDKFIKRQKVSNVRSM